MTLAKKSKKKKKKKKKKGGLDVSVDVDQSYYFGEESVMSETVD